MNRIIAFTGPAGAGKSTAAAVVAARYGYYRLSFAAPIRAMLMAFGLTGEQLGAGKEQPLDWLPGQTPRRLMQTLGTEWGRQLVDPNIWVKLAMRRAQWALGQQFAGVVFDDCRFDNEAMAIREAGGIVVKIRGREAAVAPHSSEAGVDDMLLSGIITNHGSVETFAEYVLSFFRCLETNAA